MSEANAGGGSANVRLWPGWVIIFLQAGLYFGANELVKRQVVSVNNGLQFGKVFGPMAFAALALLWWVAFSRTPAAARWCGAGVFALGVGGFVAAAHPSMTFHGFDEGPFPFGLLAYALPTVTTLAVLGVSLAAVGGRKLGYAGGAAGALLGAAGWCLVRNDGGTSAMQFRFEWRWAETKQDKFQAEQDEEERSADRAELAALREQIPPRAGEGDWPRFRGAGADSILEGVTFKPDWKQAPPKLIWSQRAGSGWATFAAVGDFAFTMEQRVRGRVNEDGEKEKVDEETAVCYHLPTGKEAWVSGVKGRFFDAIGGLGPRATPTFHDGKLYVAGAAGSVRCLNAKDGSEVWAADLREDAGRDKPPAWGFSSSPVVAGDAVLLYAGGDAVDKAPAAVVAYHRETGSVLWKAEAGFHGYTTALVTKIAGVEQALFTSDAGVHSLDPATGRLLWSHEWSANRAPRVAQPAVYGDSVVIGKGPSKGVRQLKVSYNGDAWVVKVGWEQKRFKPYFDDMVVFEGHIYGYNESFATCLDAETGEIRWRERHGNPGQLLLIKDMKMFVSITERGQVYLFDADGDEYNERGSWEPTEEKVWAHPVIAGGRLLIRDRERVYCYRLPQ